MAELSTSHTTSSFDELGLLTDEMIQVFTFRIGNKDLVPVPSTFQAAHANELRSVLQGYLRAPKRAPLPLAGLSRGSVSQDTKRSFSGRRVDVNEFSRDGAFFVASAVIRPIVVEYNFSGILEKTAHFDELAVDLMRMFHSTVYQFSIDYKDWGRVGCTLRMNGGIEDATEILDAERVVGFNVPLSVETYVFQETQVERRVTRIETGTSSTMVWEGDLPHGLL